MTQPIPLVEVWRGDLLESSHFGHVAVADAGGNIVWSLGDADKVIFPRSACKMVQALPLITSGAAAKYGLNSEHLALACASHNGAAIHTSRVNAWMADLDLSDADLRCGPQDPADKTAHEGLILARTTPCQVHNNCSGKHAGFLTLSQHLAGGPEYLEIDHPVQSSVRAAFEEATQEDSPTWAIDGCSAPNFATTLSGLARAMAWFASAGTRQDRASTAAGSLVQAMTAHPELVAGEGRACTALMRAMDGRVAIKTGAEGVFIAIVPERQLGIALKVTDGATRASECAIAAVLASLGVLDPKHPAASQFLNAPIRNRRDIVTGTLRATKHLRVSLAE